MTTWLDLPRPWIIMAPMDGIGDWPFREICYWLGADLTVSPLMPALGLIRSPKRLLELVGAGHGDRPFIAQLFGKEPDHFRQAARLLTDSLPLAGIDINMGCPSDQVCSSRHGASLMREPELAAEIVAATRAGTELPVSAKIRTGWDESSVNAPELAQLLEAAGASALAIHGRNRAQQYRGPVSLEIIAATKRAVSIPVVGNGDVVSVETARRMLELTGVDGLMIGRGAFGYPWLFAQLRLSLRGEPRFLEESPPRADVMREHARLAFTDQIQHAALTLRKHLIAYTHGVPDSVPLRRIVKDLHDEQDVERWIAEFAVLAEAAELAAPPTSQDESTIRARLTGRGTSTR